MYKSPRRSTRKRMPKTWKYVISFVLIYCLVSFVGSIYDLYKLNSEAAQLKAKVAKLEAKNNKLREKIKMVQSNAYIEKVAREELGLVKKNETLIITTDTSKTPGVWKVNTDSAANGRVTD